MSLETFDDDCPGCMPALIDMRTGQPLPADSPEMMSVHAMWRALTTFEERRAFHQVSCQNSREPEDMALMRTLLPKIKAAIERVKH